MTDLARSLRPIFDDVGAFSRVLLPRWQLRPYQLDVAHAIADSVIHQRGEQFAVVFSRQSGKDETFAQVIAWLLLRHQRSGGSVVFVCPTHSPQAMRSRERLIQRLKTTLTLSAHGSEHDVVLGSAKATYYGADQSARGDTADLLLVANEAQDIDPARWDAVFDPMAASTNATTVFVGTVWDQQGLLDRQMKHVAALQEQDGHQRLWLQDWEQVARVLPAYGQRVRRRIAQFGIDHPYIKTEYRLITLDSEGGLFPPARLAQLQGDHERRRRRAEGAEYALLIDVAGEEETDPGPEAFDTGAKRDATALTVLQVARGDGQQPRYQVVDRLAWTGRKHSTLHPQLVDLAVHVWQARWLVVDATGVGAGLASFLADSLRRSRIHVEPFVFTGKSKSDLGYNFLSLIDSGRFKEYAPDVDPITSEAWRQYQRCTYELLPGPSKLMRWSVPQAQGHDDLLVSAALAAHLDTLDLAPRIARGSVDDV